MLQGLQWQLSAHDNVWWQGGLHGKLLPPRANNDDLHA